MKILYINAMGAKEKNPMGGIFVTQRIKALQQMNVEVIPQVYSIEYSKLTKFIMKHVMHKPLPELGETVGNHFGVEYEVRKVDSGVLDALLNRFRIYMVGKKIEKSILNDIEKNEGIDLIHLHWLWPVGIGVKKVAESKKIPYILTCHGSDVLFGLKIKNIKVKMLEIMENAFAVEFVSNALLQSTIELGYSGKNARVIYNGIDTEVFWTKQELRRPEVIGFVGNLIEVKGADRIPVIFRQIYERTNGTVRFIVVGQGPLEESIKKEMIGVPVCFTGALQPNELAEEYRKMDILVIPSRSEGYSCVAKEAQACGVIPVGNDIGGIKEAISEYGTVVKCDDDEEVSVKIAEVVLEYIEGKRKTDVQTMVKMASEASWINRQKESIRLYKKIEKR